MGAGEWEPAAPGIDGALKMSCSPADKAQSGLVLSGWEKMRVTQRWRRSALRVSAVAVAVLALLVSSIDPGVADSDLMSAAGNTAPALGPFSRFAFFDLPFPGRALTFEPVTASVLVSGENDLLIMAWNGTNRTVVQIPDLAERFSYADGYTAMAPDGVGGVWLSQTNPPGIHHIDVRTRSFTRAVALPEGIAPGIGALAVVDGIVVFGFEPSLMPYAEQRAGVARFDPETGGMDFIELPVGNAPPVARLPQSSLVAVKLASQIELWDFSSTAPAKVRELDTGGSGYFAFLDGRRVVLTYGYHSKIIDVETGGVAPETYPTSGPVTATAANGGWIAFGTYGQRDLWMFRPGNPAPVRGLDLGEVSVVPSSMAFNPEGTVLYTLVRNRDFKEQVVWLPTDTIYRNAYGDYTPLSPARILDTRNGTGTGAAGVPLGPGGVFDLQVTGSAGVPSSGVLAVAVNVTAVDPKASGHLTVYPAGIPTPATSTLNVAPGDVRPNLALVRVGDGGRITIRNHNGHTHVVVDVQGYFSATDGAVGSRFHVAGIPVRLLDTRSPGIGMIPGGWTFPFDATLGNKPGITAVALNVTVTEPTAPMYLTVHPSGEPPPLASNLNARPGETVANLVIARLGSDGKVALTNSAGFAHVVVDVLGWFDGNRSTDEGRFIPLDQPLRLFDTRETAPVRTGEIFAPVIGGSPAVPSVTQGTAAVVINNTVTQPSSRGHLTVYPTEFGIYLPVASNLNWTAGQTIANAAIARLGQYNQVSHVISAGHAHLISDLTGVFTSFYF